MKVFVHGGAATPFPLLEALAKRGREAPLKNVQLIHIHTEGHDQVVSPEFDGRMHSFYFITEQDFLLLKWLL